VELGSLSPSRMKKEGGSLVVCLVSAPITLAEFQ
jgi:hypothetical protein